jgi:aldehyde dehydrogenase (NAD+)
MLIYKFADLIEKNVDELSMLESLDNGKPRSFSKNVDFGLAVKTLRYYAGIADKI